MRRVGKTRLILEFLEGEDLCFFVNKNKTSKSLLEEFSQQLRINSIISKYERIEHWEEFFEIIFERFSGVVVFDEFQNFEFVDKEVFGNKRLLYIKHPVLNFWFRFFIKTILNIIRGMRDLKNMFLII